MILSRLRPVGRQRILPGYPFSELPHSHHIRFRQSGQSTDIIAYADKANTRLRSKYYKMIRHGKKKNVAVAAVARELACFVWGMMTGNIA